MRLKLTLDDESMSQDLLVTAEGTVTVRELAETLATVTGVHTDAPLTIRTQGLATAVRPEAATLLDPIMPVGESSLRSGGRVSLAPVVEGDRAARQSRQPAAVLRVLEGPDSGREFSLSFGTSFVGRDDSCDVALSDDYVSKHHLRISVTDVVEVVDLGSANGMSLDGEIVQRAVVQPTDSIALGDTVMTISPLVQFTDSAGAGVGFNRPPRVTSAYAGIEVDLPEPPQPARGLRFPLIAMVAPVLLGLVMYAITRSPTTVVFVALSPLLMIGSFADQWRQARAETSRKRVDFQAELGRIRQELDLERQRELASRLEEHASSAEGTIAVEERNGLLWSRRPDLPGFLDVRLGLGEAVSRNRINKVDRRRATAAEWDSLIAISDEFTHVGDCPIISQLSVAGGLGIAGPEAVMVGVARSVVLQLACLHSPAELALVAVGSSSSVAAWDWLKWLPHVFSAHNPVTDVQLANNAATSLRLVAELEELMAARAQTPADRSGDAPVALPAVVMVVLDDAPVERSRLVQIAEHGPGFGVHVIWCAGGVGQLPAACRSFVDIPASGAGTVGFVHTGEKVSEVTCEFVDDEVATHVARRMAPLVDLGARVDDVSDLPRSVSFLGSLGAELGNDADAVAARWRANDPALTPGGKPRKEPLALRAVVGQAAHDVLALDLRTHGPHALVGGTTGAGKSEFLQTWILGMATTQSPERVTFLFVDYKGGSAFSTCTALPHSVGIVTDLSPHLVRRALASLKAELVYREQVLERNGVKDLIELERSGRDEQLPSLVIVVDEFAALVQEVPEFIDGVMDVAQRGRSLGLHLILATQKPGGVIKGSLRSNTNLRIALRMADADDSVDVLGDPLAAGFDPAVPGRAAVKTGPGRLNVFQSLYVGGVTADEQPSAEIFVERLEFGVRGELRVLEQEVASQPSSADPPMLDIDRVVAQVRRAHAQLGIRSPRRPWVEPLADSYELASLSQRSDAELSLGVQDQPQRQTQRTVHFRPDLDGNMVVFGTGGSGKSTALRTLAVSAGLAPEGAPCDVYALDFGSRGLSLLEALPHVGAVISGADHERVSRLLRWLRDEVEDRSRRYARANASTITEYRERTQEQQEKRLLVLVDGYSTFRQEYEIGSRSAWFTLFGQLAADGRSVGLHFVITADRPGAIPPSLSATIQKRLVLRMSDVNDYSLIGAPPDVLNDESPPGRGILDGLEVQVAVPGSSASLPKQLEALNELQARIASSHRRAPQPIERLAERVSLEELPLATGQRITVGLSDEDLKPCAIPARGSFLVVGPPASGRTTSLATLASSFHRQFPDAPAFLFTVNSRSPLSGLPFWTDSADEPDRVMLLATKLQSVLGSGSGSDHPGLLVIEGLQDISGSTGEPPLESLVRIAIGHGCFVVGEAETSALSQIYSGGIVGFFRLGRRGIALQPEEQDGTAIFKTTFPRVGRSEFPVGRGIAVDAGAVSRVQMALPE